MIRCRGKYEPMINKKSNKHKISSEDHRTEQSKDNHKREEERV